MLRKRLGVVAACVTLVVPVFLPRASAAEPSDDARTLFEAGSAAFVARRYAEGALAFEAAAKKKPHAASLLMAARSWDLAGQPERAADSYARALAAPGLEPENARAAEERLRALERTLGVLEVTAAAPHRVQLDGFTETDTPARLHGAPGVHTLTVRGPEGTLDRHAVTLDLGSLTRFEVKPPEPPAPKPVIETPKAPIPAAKPTVAAPPVSVSASADEPQAASWPLRRTIGVASLGAGALALASAGLLWREALETRDAYNESPTRSELDRAQALVTWTNVALALGAAGLATGALVLAWPTGGSAKVVATPGGVTVAGRF